MGIVGMLLAALIIGFLVMTNMSSRTDDETAVEVSSDQHAPLQINTATPVDALNSVQQRADSLLQSSEDKYRELDK